MPSELTRIEAQPRGMFLDDVGHALIGCRIRAEIPH
jgi:hypothetical protein